MTDEAKALGRAAATIWAWVPIGEGRVEHVNACGKAADLIETQAREIERLRGTVQELITLVLDAGLSDDLVAQLYPDAKRKNGQPAYDFAKRVRRTINEARAALAGDSHDQ